MSNAVEVRDGRESDFDRVLAMWDGAVEWMVARGQSAQWGTEPMSTRPRAREHVREWTTGSGLRIAEICGQTVGASVIADRPPEWVPPTSLQETYLLFLISAREHAGKGIGAELVKRVVDDARQTGSGVLRVDCWAGASGLVAWYERQGFVRSDTFVVSMRGHSWHGQVFEMALHAS